MAGTTKRPAAAIVTKSQAERVSSDGRGPATTTTTTTRRAKASAAASPPKSLAPPAAEEESNAASPSLDAFDPETRAAVNALLEAVPDASVLASPNPRAAEAARRALAALYKYSLRSSTHANATAAATAATASDAPAAPSTPGAPSLPPGVLPELYAGPGFDVEQVSSLWREGEEATAFGFRFVVAVNSLGGPAAEFFSPCSPLLSFSHLGSPRPSTLPPSPPHPKKNDPLNRSGSSSTRLLPLS